MRGHSAAALELDARFSLPDSAAFLPLLVLTMFQFQELQPQCLHSHSGVHEGPRRG